MSEADGFLSDVTSGTPIQATFAFNATWAPDTGLHITGGAQLEIDLPLHIDLGPVTIETVYVIAGVASDGLTLELAAALGVTLGPIQASVDKVGVAGTLSFPQGGGNLGPANLQLGFKPPDGLGLEIDAGPASRRRLHLVRSEPGAIRRRARRLADGRRAGQGHRRDRHHHA